MNSRRWTHTILGLMGVAVVTATLIQTRQVFTLQAEAMQLREQTEQQPAEVLKTVTDVDVNLNQEEKMELLRLRGEYARLHQRQRELAPLSTENRALLARVATAQANEKPGAIALPPGYIRRKDARFAGYGTPEAALESLFWAIANRDTNTLWHIMPQFAHVFFGAEAEKSWKEIEIVPGFRILKNETQSDSSAFLTIEMLPGEERKIKAQKHGEEWQLDGF